MRRATYDSLMLIHQRYGSREFGKMSQKLLAISFRSAGFGHIVERGPHRTLVTQGGVYSALHASWAAQQRG